MSNSRRTVLQMAAALAAMPPNLRAALASPARSRRGTVQDVEHVVILMQENRSFDHYFGTLRGVRGFSDPRAITLPGGKPVWYQPKGNDTFTPFHLDTRATSAQCMASLDHSWKGSYDLWKNHDAWIETKTNMTMGYFTRRDIPFYHALADAFTICDAYHCSVFGPTNPNRLHLFSGTSGLTAGDDKYTCVANPTDEDNETADIGNDSKAFKAFAWATYAEQLQKAGIDWRVYQEYDNYGDNGLAYFENFRSGGDPALIERARAWVKGSNKGNAQASRGEHLVAAFAQDVAMGRLPQVSWIVAPYIMCEHPSANPAYGEALTAQLLDVLAANKDVWAKTVFILNYDENDGFFDHMPPANPAITPDMGASTVDTTGEVYHGVPFGFGPRVPMIVVSPWTVGGFVNSQLFDHTSVLRFLETRFGVAAPNISDWRRAVTGDLTSVFDFTQAGVLERYPDGSDGMKKADKQCKSAPPQWQQQALPQQERGQRPARALPYYFSVEGRRTTAGFRLKMWNTGHVGVVFRVASSKAGEGPWFFTVGGEHSLTHTLPIDGLYDFHMLGPNGFYRRFTGGADDTLSVGLDCNVPRLPRLLFANAGMAAVAVVVRNLYEGSTTDFSVQPGNGPDSHLDSTSQANWYDLVVEVPDTDFRWHLAGHIEDRNPSLSDPLLG